ncbi:MAG TPA: hypothetical protein PKM25_11450 [Candidatus Ozemobacteraceae bacterium]|nr:hypothetical protein [Candidatus Ozemobacteraceae bacterium]
MSYSLERNQLLLFKVEDTSGSDATPTKDANAINCASIEWGIDPETLQQIEINRYLDDPEVILGRKLVPFTVKCSLKGSGTAGTAPQLAAFFKCCAFKETITALTSCVYNCSSVETDHKTGTAYIYDTGRLIKVVGCMGNVSNVNNAGQQGLVTLSMQGKFLSQEDASLPASPTFESTTAPIVQSAGITFGAWANAVVRSLSFSSGNKIGERRDCNSVDGVLGMFIGGRDTTFQALVESVNEATKPFIGNMLSGTKEQISETIGATAGNIVTITAVKCKTNKVDVQRQEGINLLNLTGQCRADSGDDNLVFSFT